MKRANAFALECKQRIRQTDMLGRWGGEEFVLLMPGTNISGAFTVCEACRKAIEKLAIRYEDKTLRITASIGLAEYSASDVQLSQIINRADDALYIGKKQGRNQCVIEATSRKQISA